MAALSSRYIGITSLVLAGILGTGCASKPAHEKEILSIVSTLSSTQLSPPDYALEEMIKSGVKPEFAKSLEKKFYQEKKNNTNRDQIVELNVLGFLSPGDYSKHYSANAVKHIGKFIKKYNHSLAKAEKDFQVPREVIASLLWVETKHGKTMGQFHLPFVYFSLLQGTHPEVAKTVLLELNNRKPSSNSAAASMSYNDLQKKVVERLTKKSKWALEQLKTVEKHPKTMLGIKSSFAGAFGCSQFIPSSYEKYAVSYNKKTPNLFDMKDCIMSVANFLRQNGWDTQNPKAQSDALFEYNRIRDYGDVILKLSADVRQKT